MFMVIRKKRILFCIILFLAALLVSEGMYRSFAQETEEKKDFIKWVDFNVPYEAMDYALKLDIKSQEQEVQLNWVELLAYTAAKNGGNFNKFKTSQLDAVAELLGEGQSMEELARDMKYYKYFREAYGAVLDGFVGEYEIEVKDETSETGKRWETKYGLKAFLPIAKGYPYQHYDDFGSSRTYGYKRKHLGHDMMGAVGTPVIAVESGVVEHLGWNQYGGWRVGIRSYDGKRYYYYAHLRQNFPYNKSLAEGSEVQAGDVIGYLGRTGYSSTENTNNIQQPHLHFGMQLIFDESQEEGNNEIWIDVYQIVKLLSKNQCAVLKNQETKDYYRIYEMKEVQGAQE